MTKQRVILLRWMCWISAIAGIVSWASSIVANQLCSTFARSSSALASSAPLKSCPRHPCILVKGPCFSLNPIGGSSIHHLLITSTCALIVSHRSTKIRKQLLQVLRVLLQQMAVFCSMLSPYLTNRAPHSRHHTQSCLCLWP